MNRGLSKGKTNLTLSTMTQTNLTRSSRQRKLKKQSSKIWQSNSTSWERKMATDPFARAMLLSIYLHLMVSWIDQYFRQTSLWTLLRITCHKLTIKMNQECNHLLTFRFTKAIKMSHSLDLQKIRWKPNCTILTEPRRLRYQEVARIRPYPTMFHRSSNNS